MAMEMAMATLIGTIFNRKIKTCRTVYSRTVWLFPTAKPSVHQQKQEYDDKKELLSSAMNVLNERGKEIITARRLKENPITLEELSKKYKISRERIRQIETKAFEKLQKSMINASKSKNLLPAN